MDDFVIKLSLRETNRSQEAYLPSVINPHAALTIAILRFIGCTIVARIVAQSRTYCEKNYKNLLIVNLALTINTVSYNSRVEPLIFDIIVRGSRNRKIVARLRGKIEIKRRNRDETIVRMAGKKTWLAYIREIICIAPYFNRDEWKRQTENDSHNFAPVDAFNCIPIDGKATRGATTFAACWVKFGAGDRELRERGASCQHRKRGKILSPKGEKARNHHLR